MAHEGHDHHHHEHHHHEHHRAEHSPQAASATSSVGCWVITCSDSRTNSTDEGGPLAARLLSEAGHSVLGSSLVKDEIEAIGQALDRGVAEGARCVVLTGGTGLGRRDVTVEALAARWTRRLPGFGELFRALSFAEIGAAAWLSRAEAGVCDGTLVFLLPGSPRAVKLALERLILPQLSHAAFELVR